MLQINLAYASSPIAIAGGANLSTTISSAIEMLPNIFLQNATAYSHAAFNVSDPVLLRRCRVSSVFSGRWSGAKLHRGVNGNGYSAQVLSIGELDVQEWADCNIVLPVTAGSVTETGYIYLDALTASFANETSQSITAKWFFEAEIVYGVPLHA
jgi:hypothetical protein